MKKAKTLIIRSFIATCSFLHRNAVYGAKTDPVKVNLGCGLHCLPGWINVDGSLTALLGSKRCPIFNKALYALAGSSAYYTFDHYDTIIRTCDLKFFNLKGSVPLADRSADIIYTSHFLEHLSKSDGRYFLQECFRSLKAHGLLRIAVPDLDVALRMHQDGEVERMQDLFYYTSAEWDFAAHKYNYSFAFLKEVLERIGFTEVRRRGYQEGDCPDIGHLDVYPEHSLYVECRK